METVCNKLEKSMMEVKVTFTTEEWKKAQEKALDKLAKQVKMDGFRKGHVPKQMVKARLGKGTILEEATDMILQQNYSGILLDNDIRPVGQPEVKIDEISEDVLKLTVTAPVAPEVQLGQYKGLEVKKTQVKVTKKEIEAELKNYQNQFAELVIKEDGQVGVDPLDPGLVGFAELCDQGRDGQNGGREDRRNNAAHIDLQRQIGRGSAVHLTANHTTGVLHRNTTLGKLDVDDEDHDNQQHADDRGELRPIAIGAFGAPTDLPQLRQEAGTDGHEDKDGHTLAKTLIGDQFGHPHDQARTTGHDQHHDHEVPDGTVRHDLGALIVEQGTGAGGHQNGGGLQHSEANGQVTGVLGQLGFTRLAFLMQRLKAGNDHAEQLDDDRCRDVRHDA